MNKYLIILAYVLIHSTVGCGIDSVCAQGTQTSQKIVIINIPSAEHTDQTKKQPSLSMITVGPLIARRSDQTWLNKAIADLLIKNLSEVHSLTVLEREKMQAFSNEVGLKDSALFNQEKALRVGRVARVDQVVFGNYVLKSNIINVYIYLMDLKTQDILLTEKIEGPYDQLRMLMKQLVFQFLARQKVALSEAEKENIEFKATDSITATEHFYRGIDLYDQGKYPDAFGEFLRASRQDTKYFEAHLFVGKMFEAQRFYDHAVLYFKQLHDQYPQTVEARDALFFAGKILELKLGEDQKAIDIYQKLSSLKPVSAHSLQASFSLGNLFYRKKEYLNAYLEFKKVDDYKMKVKKNPSAVERRQVRVSRFVTWHKALELYKESIVNMISIYQKLIDEVSNEQLPKPPRGVIVLDPDVPYFKEADFGHTESLFPDEQKHPNWHEELYAVLVPKGFAATGIEFSVTGQMKQMSTTNDYTMRILPFPLPLDFDQNWYGVIFGQTRDKTTLNKFVSFHGKKLDVFAIQLLENHSTIHDWEFKVRLLAKNDIKDEEVPSRIVEPDIFWEGKPVAHIPLNVNKAGTTRLLQEAWYKPKKDMDLLHDPMTGNYLVVSQGQLDSQQTDLWITHSRDTEQWPPLERLSINSSSKDYNPGLIRSEDGKIWLTWISNRRGRGWELWMSHLKEDQHWSHPQRIPLEKFAKTGMEELIKTLSYYLLEYDVFQDNRGLWIIVYYSYKDKGLVLIQSKDMENWSLLSKVPTDQAGFGFSLVQDSSAVYRLGMIGNKGQLYLFSSNDAVKWDNRQMKFSFWGQSFLPTPMIHRMRLIPLELGHLLMLISDDSYGLQFARFHADTGEPRLDLVTRVGLDAYAVTKVSKNNHIVAIKEDENVVLRSFKKFNISGKEIDKDTRGWPIYKETEVDSAGNKWTRIFAQVRRIVPDVTALGLQPNGRIWWGIETGIMYKHNEHFFATDVSSGFFYHFVTDITSCSDKKVWFSSEYLNKPEIGFVNNPPILNSAKKHMPQPRFQRVMVPEVKGALVDIDCSSDNKYIYIGSSQGNIVGFDGNTSFWDCDLSQNDILNKKTEITSLAYNKKADELWVGTKAQGLLLFYDKKIKNQFDQSNNLPANNVTDLEVDKEGNLWAALYGQGLMRYKGGEWKHFTKDNSELLYWSIDHLVADPKEGVWYLPHDDIPSRGLGYFDGVEGESFNPPHRILPDPSSLAVEPDGTLWIGTWFNGLYKLQRKDISL